MGDVRINIRLDDKPGTLKVVWNDVIEFPPYFVDLAPLNQRAKQLRSRLQAFVQDSMRKDGPPRYSHDALREIARVGRELFDLFFLDAGGSEVDPNRIKDWLARQPSARITVSVDSRVHIPWGLLFEGDPNDIPASDDVGVLREHGAFWCLRRKLAAIHYRLAPDRLELPSSLNILPIVHRQALDAAAVHLSTEEREEFARFQERYGLVCQSSDLERRWAHDTGLLYFYCHADGNTLELDSSDRVDATSLRLLFDRAAAKRTEACMVFLNGCSTASGHSDGGFLEATGQPGMCGFIGTEALVPDVFALRFSLAFLTAFIGTGRPVYEVMHELWHKHFPMSLLYSMYTYPLLQVPDSGAPPPAALVDENFSLGVLGSDTL